MVPPASPSSGAAQLCTFCPLGPRAPGKPMEPFSPCSPLVPCKQKLRSAQGRRESFSHCMATAQPWSPPRPGLAAPLAPCPWCLLAPAHRAQGCHHALLPLSIALSTALHDPQPSSSQPGTSFPQPCTFSPSMPCSPLSPLSPSVPFRPRSPCKGGNTGRGQGMRRSSDTHQSGEDRPRLGAGTWGSVGWLKEMGQYALQGRVPQQEEAPPAPPRGTGRMGRGRTGTALTGSPLLPRAPGGPSTTTVSPCTPKAEREVGVSREARAAACLSTAPHPKDSPCLLWVLGPQGPPVRKVRCCKDALQGAGSTSQYLEVHHSPPSSSAHRVPYLVPTLPPVPRQALWGRREGWSGRGPDQGAAGEGGYLLLAHDPLLALGAHLHPARRKGCEKGVWVGGSPASPHPRDRCSSGAESCQGWRREPSCLWLWGHGGTVAVPTRGPGSPRSPLAPGSPAPGAPCQGKARTHPHRHCPQLLPALPGTPPCQETPHSPHHLSGCLAHRKLPCATIQSRLSTLRGRWLQGHSSREAASHLSCYRAAPGPTLSPFRPGAPCMP